MINFLVETKHEYTTQLLNILTPLVYDGIKSIYDDVKKVSSSENVLKNFQMSMQNIPKWNNDIIINETQRILNNSKSYLWLSDLIKATLKANIIVLTYNPTVKEQVKIDPTLYKNIKIEDFIHKVYIECARNLWNNPYLFYHNYSPIELKRNQRDILAIIKDCIMEAIRKLLPVKYILQIYLNEDINLNNEIDFNKPMSEVEEHNLNKLIKKDIYEHSDDDVKRIIINQIENTDSDNKVDIINNKVDNINNKLNDEQKLDNINNKIQELNELNIIDKSIDNAIHMVSEDKDVENNKNKYLIDNDSESSKNSNDIFNFDGTSSDSNDNDNNILSKTSHNNSTVGSKILGIINNKNIRLSSIDNNNNFQEIFSNGNTQPINLTENNNEDNKKKFFSKYLDVN
jgi:hypothetical protein